MLTQLLNEIRAAGGVITYEDLSQRMGVDRGVVEDMVNLLRRKGVLSREESLASSCHVDCSSCAGACGPSAHRCPGCG
ncbi:MAG: MarR family transcriptional regulator [Chloroflexi bacterium]|jgi:predicted transcriptional regulator|nr:helix-turn-helix domain-containing protein [Anaerolineaceae bacterium]NMB87624.1 MarR family transcriptional regulator [Chloroflexota bacterium]